MKVIILKIVPLKIKLNVRNKKNFVVNFTKRNGKNLLKLIKPDMG